MRPSKLKPHFQSCIQLNLLNVCHAIELWGVSSPSPQRSPLMPSCKAIIEEAFEGDRKLLQPCCSIHESPRHWLLCLKYEPSWGLYIDWFAYLL